MSAPLAWIALGVIVGAYAFVWWSLPLWHLCLLFLVAVFGAGIRLPKATPFAFILLGFVLAQTSLVIQPQAQPPSARVSGQVLSVSGRYASISTPSGRLWSVLDPAPPPPGTWITGQTRPLQSQPIMPGAWLSHAQARLAKAASVRFTHWVALTPPKPKAEAPTHLEHHAILQALGTGDRSRLSKETLSLLRRTGVVHLLAISGLHVGIIASIGGLLAWLCSRRLTRGSGVRLARVVPHLGAALAAIAYGHVVGWPVSAQRAVCMLVIASTTLLMGRRINPWQVLGGAAIGVFIVEPSHIASLSFLMSFSAVTALIAWMPLWSGLLSPQAPRWIRWVHNGIGTTACASFGTLPICAWVFQQLPIASPLANLLAVPLFAAIAVPATLLGLLGPSSTSEVLLSIADVAVGCALWWVKLWDLGVLNPAVGWGGAILLWFAIFASKRVLLAVVCVVLALSPRFQTHNDLELHFPAVGQGSACLVRWPDGRHWLIDGGPPGTRVLHWLRRRGVRHLERVFLSHPDSDHMGGLIPVIDAISVGEVWTSRPPPEQSTRYDRLLEIARIRAVPVRQWEHADSAEGSDNDTGLVVTIRHGIHSFLILGDISSDVEASLATGMPKMTAIQVSHHGSQTSSHPLLIDASQAEWGIIQVGKGNRYGHPHPDVLKKWSRKSLLRTDTDGSIRLKTNGVQLSVSTWTPQRLWTPATN